MKMIKQELILKVLRKHKMMKVSDLEKIIKIPRTSLLRYLTDLEASGKITKMFGEVKLRMSTDESNPFPRLRSNKSAKEKIAKHAAKLVNNGDIIFLDSGSTNYFLAKALANKNIKIYTNNIIIAHLICSEYQPSVNFIPGEVHKTTLAICSSVTISFLNTLRFDKIFIGFNSYAGGMFATTNENEAVLKRALVELNSHSGVYMVGRQAKEQEEAKYIFIDDTRVKLINETGVY